MSSQLIVPMTNTLQGVPTIRQSNEETHTTHLDAAAVLVSESVGPNPIPPIFILPQNEGLTPLFAVYSLAPM